MITPFSGSSATHDWSKADAVALRQTRRLETPKMEQWNMPGSPLLTSSLADPPRLVLLMLDMCTRPSCEAERGDSKSLGRLAGHAVTDGHCKPTPHALSPAASAGNDSRRRLQL